MGDTASNAHMEEGLNVHRAVDHPSRISLPDPDDDTDPDRPKAVRSVKLSDPDLGLIGVCDLVHVEGREVTPIEYKKGVPAPNPEASPLSHRVQVCGQVLLLRAHGYTCERGILYYAGAKRRVEVEITPNLIATTLACRDQAREILRTQVLPPPLVASPKCDGCSLVGICLPDETAILQGEGEPGGRRLVPARDDGVPMHVQLYGGRATLSGAEIVIVDKTGETVARNPLRDVSELVLHGNVTLTTPLIAKLAEFDIFVGFHSYGGWYQSNLHATSGRNVLLRHAQHLAAADPAQSLTLAKGFIASKIRNQRVMLRRNAKGIAPNVLDAMRDCATSTASAPDADTLRGLEGYAARLYFENFTRMIKPEFSELFSLDGRNRRPPRDPVNAMLSFAYGMLVREFDYTACRVGFDPYIGFLHTIRPGRPALALDLMEEFRPLVADSSVINAINNGVVQAGDFDITPVGCQLRQAARKRFIQVVEARLNGLVTHPIFEERWSYKRMFEVQARVLGKVLRGEIEAYRGFETR